MKQENDLSQKLIDLIYPRLPMAVGLSKIDPEFNDDGTITLTVDGVPYVLSVKIDR